MLVNPGGGELGGIEGGQCEHSEAAVELKVLLMEVRDTRKRD